MYRSKTDFIQLSSYLTLYRKLYVTTQVRMDICHLLLYQMFSTCSFNNTAYYAKDVRKQKLRYIASAML